MEKLQPTREWVAKYEQVKGMLESSINYAECFEKDEIQGKKVHVLDMGEVIFPTGEILAADPLTWLSKNQKPYFQSVPIGKYRIETLVVEIEENYYRYALTRVKFTDEKPMRYRQALKGNEDLSDVDKDTVFGFPVDAGLATIVDVQTRDAYCDFEDHWDKENPDENIYDGFFDDKFKESAAKNPLYQREDGDWINFQIPNTGLRIPMIEAGFGDGFYPVYFGYDGSNHLCDVVIEYIFLGEPLEDL